ncbi:uncharacterized protein LOC110441010, partial [Mizuhopecten yessoensis]|uniref:uncharacterized protein LOC110441010 n=1 Tax=Mizuhopecten yessoensis TaxID=6573 RepID=UPI000B45BE02
RRQLPLPPLGEGTPLDKHLIPQPVPKNVCTESSDGTGISYAELRYDVPTNAIPVSENYGGHFPPSSFPPDTNSAFELHPMANSAHSISDPLQNHNDLSDSGHKGGMMSPL